MFEARLAATEKGNCAGVIVSPDGIFALDKADRDAILEKVRTFDAFTPDNDPHGGHDFRNIDHNGERIFWKIDYYDAACEYGSEDPAEPNKTTRVLTIMLAEEY